MTDQIIPPPVMCNCVDNFIVDPCGCGKPDCQCRLFGDNVLHYEGKHWNVMCLINYLMGK